MWWIVKLLILTGWMNRIGYVDEEAKDCGKKGVRMVQAKVSSEWKSKLYVWKIVMLSVLAGLASDGE